MLESKGADDRLQRTGRTQSMTGGALGRTTGGGRAENAGDCAAFRAVVAGRSGTVQIDVVDVAGLELGGRQRGLDCTARTQPAGMRRRHMIGTARFSNAEQQHRVAVQVIRYALEKCECRRLADGDAVARDIEWAARRRRGELQRVKA